MSANNKLNLRHGRTSLMLNEGVMRHCNKTSLQATKRRNTVAGFDTLRKLVKNGCCEYLAVRRYLELPSIVIIIL